MNDILASALLVLAIVAVLSIIGRVTLAALAASPQHNGFDCAIGLAVVVVLAWPCQLAGMPGAVLSALIILVAIGAAAGVGVSARYREFMRPALAFSGADVIFAITAVVAAIAFFADPLREFGMSLASLGNVDPISYALDARQALASGYADTGGVANRDLANSASWNWPGAVTIQTVVAGVTHRPVGLSSMIALMTLATVGQQQTSQLALRLVPTTRGRSGVLVALAIALASVVAWLNAFGGYIIGNGFIAQLGLMALVPGAIAVTCGLRLAETSPQRLGSRSILVALLAGAMFSIYGAIAPIICVVIATVAIGAFVAKRRHVRPLRGASARNIAAAIVVLFVSALGGLLWFSYNGTLITTASTAGWPIEPPHISTLFGLTPLFSSAWTQTPLGTTDFALLVVVVAVLLLNLRIRDDNARTRLLIGASFTACSIAGMLAFGPDAYKTWKLLGTCTPFAITAVTTTVVALALKVRTTPRRLAAVATVGLGLLLTAHHAVGTSAAEWGTSPYRYGATRDLTSLLANPDLRALEGVNVEGTSLTSTMLLLLYIPTPNRVAISDSFYPLMPPRYRHTVVASSLVKPNAQRTTPLNSSYDLVMGG